MEDKKTYDDILNELREQHNIEELLNFNELNIQEKLAVNSSKVYHYTELYQKALNKYNGILELRDQLIGEKYHTIKTKSDVLLKQGEIEKYYLSKDKDVIKINEVVKRQKAYVDFYDNIRKALEKQSWNMQTYLKSLTYGI
jgi:hypothetical protein